MQEHFKSSVLKIKALRVIFMARCVISVSLRASNASGCCCYLLTFLGWSPHPHTPTWCPCFLELHAGAALKQRHPVCLAAGIWLSSADSQRWKEVEWPSRLSALKFSPWRLIVFIVGCFESADSPANTG